MQALSFHHVLQHHALHLNFGEDVGVTRIVRGGKCDEPLEQWETTDFVAKGINVGSPLDEHIEVCLQLETVLAYR